MYLSYSGHKSYQICPKQYWHRYIGNTVLPKPENGVNSLYGTVVGQIFERFYADKIWLKTGVEQILRDMAPKVLVSCVERELKKRVVQYQDKDHFANYPSQEVLLEDVLNSIPRGIQIIRSHRLLGTDAEAEVNLDTSIAGHRVGGRADFIMTRIKPHGDLVILDGKGSKHRDKYVDAWQLKWYAMLWRERTQSVPAQLGFVYWRSEPEESVDWVPFSTKDLDDLKDTVVQAASNIEDSTTQLKELPPEQHGVLLPKLFPESPSRECKLCAYLQLCPAGNAYVDAKLPVAITALLGVEDVGLEKD